MQLLRESTPLLALDPDEERIAINAVVNVKDHNVQDQKQPWNDGFWKCLAVIFGVMLLGTISHSPTGDHFRVMNQQLSLQERELELVRTSLEKNEEVFKATIAKLQEDNELKISSLQAQISQHEEHERSMNATLHGLQADVANMKEKACIQQGSGSEDMELQREPAWKAAIASLNTSIAKLQSESYGQQEKQQALDARVSQYEDEVNLSMNATIVSLKSEIEDSVGLSLHGIIDQLEEVWSATFQSLESKVEGLLEEKRALESNVANMVEKDNETLSITLDKANEELGALELEVGTLQPQIDQLQSDQKSIEEQVAVIQSRHKTGHFEAEPPCMGSSLPSDWVQHGFNTIQLVVDTSKCQFPEGSVPTYFTSLVVGAEYGDPASSIFQMKPTHDAFVVYLNPTWGARSYITSANNYDWRIQWIAFLG
ncbi:expressed unknown protein [Seminavis robusta]|uniref:Uncharacterized protein n=1 Tax=Seminavis robusta TaxID=568900 RepID=A0A9N8F274_9STRA|nr:expressed unknown protein [Seminavis robusta]|eukprot:Sro2763_g336530.1 n/a (427) ;mRNA; r:4920-6200